MLSRANRQRSLRLNLETIKSVLLSLALLGAAVAAAAANCIYHPNTPESALWVLAGQSNAEGFGTIDETPLFSDTTEFPYVRIWGIYGDDLLAGTNKRPTGRIPGTNVPYDSAVGSLDFDWAAYARQVGWQQARPGFGVKAPSALAEIGAATMQAFGPELAFAARLNEFLTPYNESGESVVHHIVKLGIGGTSLQYHWLPSASPNYLFNRLIEMTVDAINSRSDVRLRVHGLLWMQGETDGDTLEFANAYGRNLGRFRNNFVNALTAKGCGVGIHPMPLIIGRLKASGPPMPPYTYRVRQQQDNVQLTPIKYGIEGHVGIINTDDLTLLVNSPLHFDTESQIQIGYRFFDALFSDAQLTPRAFLFERAAYPELRAYFTNGAVHYCTYPWWRGACTDTSHIIQEYHYIRYDMKHDSFCSGPCP